MQLEKFLDQKPEYHLEWPNPVPNMSAWGNIRGNYHSYPLATYPSNCMKTGYNYNRLAGYTSPKKSKIVPTIHKIPAESTQKC